MNRGFAIWAIAVVAVALPSSAGVASDWHPGSVVFKQLAGEEAAGSCSASPIGGGRSLTAAFAGNGEFRRTLPYGRRALIRGQVRDAYGNPIAGALVCIEERVSIPDWEYRPTGVAIADVDGVWTFKVRRGPSRSIRVSYSDASGRIDARLVLKVSAHATLYLSRHRTRVHRPVYFYGRIPEPVPGERIVFIRGTIPGAKRKYLIRYARTDAFGHFRTAYAFAPVQRPTKFVFWALVPNQGDYPYLLGRSANRYVRVSP